MFWGKGKTTQWFKNLELDCLLSPYWLSFQYSLEILRDAAPFAWIRDSFINLLVLMEPKWNKTNAWQLVWRLTTHYPKRHFCFTHIDRSGQTGSSQTIKSFISILVTNHQAAQTIKHIVSMWLLQKCEHIRATLCNGSLRAESNVAQTSVFYKWYSMGTRPWHTSPPEHHWQDPSLCSSFTLRSRPLLYFCLIHKPSQG